MLHPKLLQTPFFKSMKKWNRFSLCLRYFSHRILRFKICSVVLLPALNPGLFSMIISSAWCFKHVQDDFKHDFARMT